MNAKSKNISTAQASTRGGENALQRRRRRIITAAKPVFLKYGYSGITMHHLARAAGMSRAALYLAFPNKEEFFCEVGRELAREASEEAKRGLRYTKSPIEKLKFVCEVWMVRRFDWLRSPEGKEIYESSHAFSEIAAHESMISFERDLAAVIELLPEGMLPQNVSRSHAAHVLAGAITGIRNTSRRSGDLRKDIGALISLVFRA
ncbi:MAG TPA: TetR/AcrR family transcriptional regulator [Acidobacteriaceae bacterium]|nr:TetR/AcrR family transcriptional regulator [Acidobacteriaceae bacterium]